MSKKKNPLKFRPTSYWEDTDPLALILKNISGRARRELIKEYWDLDMMEKLNDELLKDQLSEEVREELGRMHPFFMGGEYLPDHHPGEITLVCISLQSTTFDAIELRALKRSDGSISLRWVDEYGTEFDQPTDEIAKPFTFGELIDFIESSGPESGRFPHCYNEYNAEYIEADTLRNFTSIDSEFYPDLGLWAAEQFEAWVKECFPEEEECIDEY